MPKPSEPAAPPPTASAITAMIKKKFLAPAEKDDAHETGQDEIVTAPIIKTPAAAVVPKAKPTVAQAKVPEKKKAQAMKMRMKKTPPQKSHREEYKHQD